MTYYNVVVVKNKKAYRALHFILSILLVFYSVAPGLTFLKPSSIYAQEATLQDSTPSATEPTITPTQTDDPLLTPTATLTPTLEVTPVPAETTPTPTPQTENVGQPYAPPADEQTPAPESSPTAEPPPLEAPSIETVIPNTSADSIENLNLEPVEVNSASLITDKADYAPIDTAVTTGSGFPKEDEIRLIITADDYHFETSVTTDSEGTFIYAYQLDGTYRPLYKVEARDLSGQILATTTFTDAAPLGKDFDQCANQDPTLGECNWIGSVLQNNNSEYNEGMSVPQRVLFTNIPATSGNVHTLTFNHQSTKGGNHAYDFLTAYNQGNSPPITLNPCDDLGGDTLTCNSLRGSANNLLVDVPDDPYVSKDGSTQSRLDAYEALYGNRQIKIYGGSSITSASFSSISHDVAGGADTGDSDISYTLTWTSASSNILIEMAGHISLGVDPAINPIGWGSGLGAGSVSGGPYHFKLDQLDGGAVGAQDNQIQAGAVILPGTITIIKNTDPDDAQNFNFSTNGSGLSSFSLDDDSDSILSNTKTFTGLAPGSFTVTEATSAEFTLSNLSCVDPTGNTTVNGPTADINLAAGETVTCTFTNIRNGGSVKVHKFVDTDGNGTFEETSDNNANGLGFRWSLDGASPTTEFGTEVSGVSAGTHNVSENSVPDYQFVSWFINGGQGSCTSPDGTSLPASITVNSNQRTEVTLCNARETGTLIVRKIVVNDNGGSLREDDFSFSVNGTSPVSFESDGQNELAVNAGTYTITEPSVDGYGTSYDNCSNVVVSNGGNQTCTITNDDEPGKISGKKFNDLNDDSTKDTGEPGLPDWTITLDKQGDINPPVCTGGTLVGELCVEITNSSGNYAFYGLEPGTYIVSEVLQAGWVQTRPNASYGGQGRQADGTYILTIGSGDEINNRDFGNRGNLSITACKFEDSDGTEDGGDLSEVNNWNFSLNGQTTQNTDDGNCTTFENLAPGDYTVSENPLPDGWFIADNSGGSKAVSLTSESQSVEFYNFRQGEISGIKWDDKNGNGEQDCEDESDGFCELGLEGWTIFLDENGDGLLDEGEDFVETDEDGFYSFTDLDPGTYRVCEGQQNGWSQTFPNDPELNNCRSVIVSSNEHEEDINFGNQGHGTISVHKHADINGDGDTEDEGERGATDWTWDIDGSGDFPTGSIQNVAAGDYTISEDQKEGFHLTSVSCNNGQSLGPSERIDVSVGPGENLICGFTNTRDTGSITVIKNLDNNGDGDTLDEGDVQGATDWTWDIAEGDQNILTGQTKSLAAGTYTISEDQKEGFMLLGWSCSNEQTGSTSSITIDITNGSETTCTFTNQLQNPVLSISKSNNKTGVDVSPGSQVIYTLTIKVTQSGILGVTVKDLLPDGFAYHTDSWAAVKNGFPFSVPEPTYASPGTWLLGDLADGDIVELILTADIAGGQEPGLYKDLAWAAGTSFTSASVLANAENPGFVDGNFVGTDVKVVKGQGSTGFSVEREEQREGEVLGATTAMPETGAQALWMILVLGLLTGGAGSVFWGVKMRRRDG